MTDEHRGLLVKTFCDALSLADVLESLRTETDETNRENLFRLESLHRNAMEAGLRDVGIIDDLPAEVFDALKGLAEIVQRTGQVFSFAQVYELLANSDLRPIAIRGWNALTAAKLEKANLFPWMMEPTTVQSEPTANGRSVLTSSYSSAEIPSLEARALAVLTDHPDWTDTKIAETLHCNRTSLYRLKKFTAARELLKQDGKATMLRGSKPKDVNLDAWAEPDSDSDDE